MIFISTGSWPGWVGLLNLVRHYIWLSLRKGGRIDLSERTGEEGELRDYEVVNKWVEGVERTDFDGSSSFLSL